MSDSKIRGPVIVIAIFGLLIAVSAFIPASWFGVAPVTYKAEYDLSMLSTNQVPLDDNPAIKTEAWRATLQNNFNQVAIPEDYNPTDEEKLKAAKRLADPNNLTASFTKNSYVASAYLKENNITDAKTQQEMMDSLIQAEKAKIITTHYTTNDVRITKDLSKPSIKSYGNKLGRVMKDAQSYGLADTDIKDLTAFINTKDPSHLNGLKSKRDGLKNNIASLLAMTVPTSAISYHLLALNRLSEYLTILDNFSQAEEDPIRASMSVNDYIPSLKSLFGALNAMREYFRDNDVTFSKNEAGYMFSAIDITQ
jgi:hypothetical protein